MTELYFIRHAQSDFRVKDEKSRPLTEKGLEDSKKIPLLFEEININRIYSSPYLRSITTLKFLAEQKNLDIIIRENLKERKIGSWVENFKEYSIKQWENFDYKSENGESLAETQKRNIDELGTILKENRNQTVVIGTHGTALSTIVNWFLPEQSYDYFLSMVHKTPYIVGFCFENETFISMKEIPFE